MSLIVKPCLLFQNWRQRWKIALLPLNFILDGRHVGEGRHQPVRAGVGQRVQPEPPRAAVTQPTGTVGPGHRGPGWNPGQLGGDGPGLSY